MSKIGANLVKLPVCGPAPRLTGPGALKGGWRERETARGPAGRDTGLAGGVDRADFGRDEESALEQGFRQTWKAHLSGRGYSGPPPSLCSL
jgi:hypothetical protein